MYQRIVVVSMHMGLSSRLAIYFALLDCEGKVWGEKVAVDSAFSSVTPLLLYLYGLAKQPCTAFF